MDLHHLRHFVAVADELHFGRAAARLGMSQPPLSQSIQRLEASLGVALFKRARAGVQLTPAGVALLPHARGVLQQAELAERVARQAALGEYALLRVGFIPWSLTRALPRAIRRFRLRWQSVQVHLHERVSHQQVASLKAGELDLAVIRLKMTDTTGLETRLVEISQLVVAVPSAWPLAKRPGLRIADLSDQPLVIFRPSLSPASHDRVEAAFRAANVRPNVIQETAQPLTMLNMVANEVGIALIQNTAAPRRTRDGSWPTGTRTTLSHAERSGSYHRPCTEPEANAPCTWPGAVTGEDQRIAILQECPLFTTRQADGLSPAQRQLQQ